MISETLRQRWNSDRILSVVVVLSFIALVASSAPWGAVWLGFWQALLGTTAGLSMVLGLALATASAPETRRPTAARLMFAGVGVGIFFSGVLVPWLLDLSLAWAWCGVAAVSFAGAGLAFLGLRAAVGAFAILGPWAAVWLARRLGAP